MSKVCRTRLLFSFAVLLATASAALASNLDQYYWEQREQALTLKYTAPDNLTKKVELNIRRIKREGAPPVIISHAVVLSNIAMRGLGHLLWERGYDVWMPNTRGHGSGAELSKVEPYTTGDYGFDNIVTEDWPQLLKHVYGETSKKVSIIGYSMGGMSWEQFLSGVYKEHGRINQSDDLARSYTEWVNGFIGIVVPPDFEKTSPTVKDLLPLLPCMDKSFFIPLTVGPSNFLCFRIKSLMRNIVMGFAANQTYTWLPKGIIELEQLDLAKQDYRDFVLTRVSSPHTDYIQDFLRWFKTDYLSKDGHVNYGLNKKIFVPTLQIVATKDSLAPADQIIEKTKLFPNNARVQILKMEGFAHIDISMRKGVQAMSEPILHFLESLTPGH
ncbi:MAG: alpha/beta hydrolase [Oligoflexales bacterium]|nr:alpha/beta hydrolase [Oligoflexales bacterium]